MATYIYPNEAIVSIGAASAASTASTAFTQYLSNFNLSGGGSEIESIPLFGGFSINSEKPRDKFEITFDFVCTYETATLFESLLMGTTLSGTDAVESKTEGTDKVVYIQTLNGSAYKTVALNYARCTNVELEMAADGYMSGTVTFQATPTRDSSGTLMSNMKVAKAAASTISWT